MKLSEKIAALRKANGMTQEELASICNVSRQSITKWEADIALPELNKLLILGNVKYIVFRNKILKYRIGNQEEKEGVCEECRRLGITDAEMNLTE